MLKPAPVQPESNGRRAKLLQAVENESLLLAVLQNLPVGVRVVDAAGEYLMANAALARIWGDPRPPTDAGSEHVIRDPGGNPIDEHDWPLNAALHGMSCEPRVLKLVRPGGEAVYVRELATPLLDPAGRLIGAIGVSEDVTASWKLQSSLRQAKEAAEQASRLKDEFLATVSHELRTPLSAILLYAHLVKSGTISAKDQAEALETIYHSAKAQSQIVDDLLDLSRLNAGKLRLKLRPTALGPLVKSAVSSLRPVAQQKGISITVRIDPGAPRPGIDPVRIRQVIWNLVNNAIKFTPSGGQVVVTAGGDAQCARLEVSDNGQGISPEFLPLVFQRFSQGHRPTGDLSGLGLGLAIVRQFVELHGGTVRASSPGEGQGATFTIELPVRGSAPAEHPPDEDTGWRPGQRCLEGLHLLVVEDDALTRKALAKLLGDAGAVVTDAPGAAEALEAMARAWPDVLVSDIVMSGEDGFAMIRKVRRMEARQKNGHRRALPAIALTACASRKDRLECIRAGYQIHLPKPVIPDTLVEMIARLAGRE